MIVPTLRVVTHRLTLRVDLDAERLAMHPHAERGNDQSISVFKVVRVFVLPNGRSVPPSAGYLKGPQVTKGLRLPVWPDFVGSLHSGDAPWARAERTSMS